MWRATCCEIVKIPFCGATIQQIAEEIVSFVNRRGAQWTFGVHDPTPAQLVKQYIDTGGLQRCIDGMNWPVAIAL